MNSTSEFSLCFRVHIDFFFISLIETSKILSKYLFKNETSLEPKMNMQHEIDFQSIQDELHHIHEHFRKILISELTVAMSKAHSHEKTDLSFRHFGKNCLCCKNYSINLFMSCYSL
jgi:hypothetical protein